MTIFVLHKTSIVMSKFTKLNVSAIWKSKCGKVVVEVNKYQKENTKRMFFAPTVEGKRITSTMFSRKSGAVNLAKQYIKNSQA